MHTIYGIYHFSRSPINRPPASQASYGLFASTLDAGLIPFYVFTAFVAHAEYTQDAYNWSTLLDNEVGMIVPITQATFIAALVNGGLHLISLGVSIFLAVMFRRISHLPPDMNPLEDNLTARPRRSRKDIDVGEKHMSSSTLNSEDPLIGSPRTVAFMHTRGQSGDSAYQSGDFMSDKRQSQISVQPHRVSHLEPSSPEMLFQHPASQPYDVITDVPAPEYDAPAPEYRNVARHSAEVVNPGAQMRHMTSRAADRSNTISPLSDNWVAYSERTVSPMDENQQNNNENTLRQSSSVYSRRTNSTATSNGGFRDWFAYGQKPASIGSVIPEDTRGEYAELSIHEYYGNEEDKEQDLGDTRFNIFPDPEEHDHDNLDDENSKDLPFNPLMLNPPTPQPILTEKPEDTDPVRRYALSDNPNLTNNQTMTPQQPGSTDSTPTKGRFYGDLEEEGMPGVEISRNISNQQPMTRQPTKLTKKKSKKMSAYQSLKKDDSGDEGYLSSRSAVMSEGDRKGRVVSNSGADTARAGIGASVGASLSSYGSYIAGLGVGRRRDVSGKIAEEGRGSQPIDETPSANQQHSQGASPTRAAGWARFAGL